MGAVKVAFVVLVLLAFGVLMAVQNLPWFWPAP